MSRVARAPRRAEASRWRARGVPLTYLAFVAGRRSRRSSEHPVLNASVDGDEIVYHDDVNLGIAVALDDGPDRAGDPAGAAAQPRGHGGGDRRRRRAGARRSGSSPTRSTAARSRSPTRASSAPCSRRRSSTSRRWRSSTSRRSSSGRSSSRTGRRRLDRDPADDLPAACRGTTGRSTAPRRRASSAGSRRGSRAGRSSDGDRSPDANRRGARPSPDPDPARRLDHEELVVRRGERSGADDGRRGPLDRARPGARRRCGCGTTRRPTTASRDALRLADGMTYKAAAAGLDLGGGKGVICAPAGGPRAASAGARCCSTSATWSSRSTAATSPPRTSARRPTTWSRSPSAPTTSPGCRRARRLRRPEPVHRARRRGRDAGLRRASASARRDLAGRTRLRRRARPRRRAARAAARRRRLRAARLRHRSGASARSPSALGARWVEPGDATLAECDVLAPCALGGAIDAANVDELRCEIVCGSANNQLADDSLAEALAERGILYAPDFIANAGGLIHVYASSSGYSRGARRRAGARDRGDRSARVLAIAASAASHAAGRGARARRASGSAPALRD